MMRGPYSPSVSALFATILPALFASALATEPKPAEVAAAAVWLSLLLCTTTRRESGRGSGRRGFVAALPPHEPATRTRLVEQHRAALVESIHSREIHFYLGRVERERYCLFAYQEPAGENRQPEAARSTKTGDSGGNLVWSDAPPKGDSRGSWMGIEEVFHFDGDPAPTAGRRRFASVLGIEEKDIPAYTELHRAVWPGVLTAINEGNIRNFSIFLGKTGDDRHFLFSYYEYVGTDHEGDLELIGRDPVTRVWWTHTEPLQRPVSTRKEGEWWHFMEELDQVG
jgi:L-rhamnose mutarotase